MTLSWHKATKLRIFSHLHSHNVWSHTIFSSRRTEETLNESHFATWSIGSIDGFSMVFLGLSRQTLGQCLKIDHDHPLSGIFLFIPNDHHLLQKAMLNKQTCFHEINITEYFPLNETVVKLRHYTFLQDELLNRCSHVMNHFKERDLEIEGINLQVRYPCCVV